MHGKIQAHTVSQLDLLMVHADDRRPVLPQGLQDDRTIAKDKPATRGYLGDDGADPNDLERQRWAVIVPEGAEGTRLLSLIEPLVKARAAAQGGKEVKIYTTPAKMDSVQAMAWKKQCFDTGKDTTQDLPRYQLILGDLDKVPLAVQQVQSIDNYVGRLAFTDDQGYQAYVDKLLRWEKQPSVTPQVRSLLFTVHDQTMATEAGYRSLITPGLAVARKRKESNEFNAREIVELGNPAVPNPDELLREVQKLDPALLFTLSHGLGAPHGGWQSVEEQRKLQGAMSFGRAGVISADQVGQQPFLPGGIWFMLACYGAGTPETSAYQKWLVDLARVGQFGGQPESVLAGLPKPGDRPFIAALPQAVLRNAQGPLAFMGHVDLAWTYSFIERDSGKADPKPGRFMDILRYLLAGARVGVAFRSLARYAGQVDTDLSLLYGSDDGGRPEDPEVTAKRSHLWMLRQDLAGYILLGDPAARLPRPAPPVSSLPLVSIPAPAAASGSTLAPGLAPGTIPLTKDAAPDLPLLLPIEKLEEAFGLLLSKGRPLKDIALDFQLSHTELQRLFDLYRQCGRRGLGIKT